MNCKTTPTACVMLKINLLHDRRVQLFRVLFPSWRFFDEMGDVLSLYFRIAREAHEFGPWINCLETVERRSWSSFFLNPRGNYLSACYSLLEQLVDDLGDWDESNLERFAESVSFQLTKNLVFYQIMNTQGSLVDFPFRFQFKLSAVPADAIGGQAQDILISTQYSSEE